MSITLKEKLENEARFLRISIPYDKRDKYTMVSFDDGVMSELECDESFVPPMYDEDTKLLEFWVDLKERKVKDWDKSNGYLRIWAKVRDEGTYTLYDKDMEMLWQIHGYVPNALSLHTRRVSVTTWNWPSKATVHSHNGKRHPTLQTSSTMVGSPSL